MISAIGSGVGYPGPLTAGSSNANGAGSTGATSLAQTEEKLFAALDTNGDGSISQTELQSFFSQVSARTGAAQPADTSSLFSSLDSSGDGSISLQEFQSGAGDLVDQLRSQLATGAAAATAANANSSATSAANATDGTNAAQSHHSHHHHGGGGGGAGQGGLIASLLQQYQASGAVSGAAATGTAVSTTA